MEIENDATAKVYKNKILKQLNKYPTDNKPSNFIQASFAFDGEQAFGDKQLPF